MLNWGANKEELALIGAVADRALLAGLAPGMKIEVMMDLEAAHCNGCPLDLEALAKAPLGDMMHDVAGIHKWLNRENGKLEGCFVPRFAAKVH